jgi:hypothetical protein
VALTARNEDGRATLLPFLETKLALRNPRTPRRSCDIWRTQFDLLLRAHRAAWNQFPNPMFQLDELATACVAVARLLPDTEGAVLRQARFKLIARSKLNALPLIAATD